MLKHWTTRATFVVVVILLGNCRVTTRDPTHSPRLSAVADPTLAQFVGTWRLIRQEARNVLSGEIIPASTSESWPGILIYSADSWMSVTIDRRSTGGSYWGYFGTFHVESDKLVHTITGGIPTGRGPSPANYRFEDHGQRLVISTLPSAQNVVVDFTFERAR